MIFLRWNNRVEVDFLPKCDDMKNTCLSETVENTHNARVHLSSHDNALVKMFAGNNLLSSILDCLEIGMVKDVPTLEHLKERVDQIEKDEKAIAYARHLAHELNQPLTGISGLISLILEETNEADLHYENLKEIEKQADRLKNMIQKFQNLF